MKRVKRLVSILLVLAMVLVFPVSAMAATWASSFFTTTSTYVSKVSDYRVAVNFDVVATDIMNELGVSYLRLERSADNENWSLVREFNMEDYYSTMICENTAGHGGYLTCYTPAGYYYRCYATFYATHSTRGTGIYSQWGETKYFAPSN